MTHVGDVMMLSGTIVDLANNPKGNLFIQVEISGAHKLQELLHDEDVGGSVKFWTKQQPKLEYEEESSNE